MRGMVKNFLAITTAAILALVSIKVSVYAAPDLITKSVIYVNPIYADYITEDELEQKFSEHNSNESSSKKNFRAYYSAPPYTSAQQIGEYLREKEKARSEQVEIPFSITASSAGALEDMLSSAIAYAEDHTGSPIEGDYLKYNNLGYGLSYSYKQYGDEFEGTAVYSFAILTSSEQEQQVTDKVNQVLQSLSISEKNEAEKVLAIYEYITENVTYDYENLYNDDYILKYSTYAALLNGTAVCQGYSTLFYRLCLEAGVDARIIPGTSRGDGHAWNIVKIGSVYYNVDSTFDSGNGSTLSEWQYFLKADSDFPNHDRDSEYSSSSFTSKYPMSSRNYYGGEGSGADSDTDSGEDSGEGSGKGSDEIPETYKNLEWEVIDGKSYWYENGVKQGTYYDPKGVMGDGTIRGREIYDPGSAAWYWLDSVYDGAKACGKEVWMPYIFQNEAEWKDNEDELNRNAADSGADAEGNIEHAELADQVKKAILDGTGKWVRYDENGKMLKGWVNIQGDLATLYPDQKGNLYYYDRKTGLMAKGMTVIDGRTYYFDETTGVLQYYVP